MERRIVDLEHRLKQGKHENVMAPSAVAMAVAASATNNTSASASAITSVTSKLRPEIDEMKRHLSEMEAKIIEVSNQIARYGPHQSHATPDTGGDTRTQVSILNMGMSLFRIKSVFP